MDKPHLTPAGPFTLFNRGILISELNNESDKELVPVDKGLLYKKGEDLYWKSTRGEVKLSQNGNGGHDYNHDYNELVAEIIQLIRNDVDKIKSDMNHKYLCSGRNCLYGDVVTVDSSGEYVKIPDAEWEERVCENKDIVVPEFAKIHIPDTANCKVHTVAENKEYECTIVLYSIDNDLYCMTNVPEYTPRKIASDVKEVYYYNLPIDLFVAAGGCEIMISFVNGYIQYVKSSNPLARCVGVLMPNNYSRIDLEIIAGNTFVSYIDYTKEKGSDVWKKKRLPVEDPYGIEKVSDEHIAVYSADGCLVIDAELNIVYKFECESKKYKVRPYTGGELIGIVSGNNKVFYKGSVIEIDIPEKYWGKKLYVPYKNANLCEATTDSVGNLFIGTASKNKLIIGI